jgi:hypothetical protein
MRRRLPIVLAAAALALAAACSSSPCQELGQKLCVCTGLTGDACKTQVEDQLKRLDPNQATLDRCQTLLDSCREPLGVIFCEWINTVDGSAACGLSPEPQPVTTTTP